MDKEKEIKLNLGSAGDYSVELIQREGQAIKLLDPKPPVKVNLKGTINAPLDFIRQRMGIEEQLPMKRSHIQINREAITITLITNEDDEYTRGSIEGKLEKHPAFVKFGINEGKIWSPKELGFFFKMNRAFFPDLAINMKLVNDLMNFTARVNSKIESSASEKGDRNELFSQTVISNLPAKFTLSIPIFKGMPKEIIEIETFANIDGRNVEFVLFSPGAEQLIEEMRDTVINYQLKEITEITYSQLLIVEI